MKRIIPIFLLVCVIFIFSSCKANEPVITDADATSSETTVNEEISSTTDENNNNNTTNIIETADGITDNINGNAVSDTTDAEVGNVTNTADVTANTEVSDVPETKENGAADAQSDNSVTVQDDKIIAPAYNLEIPDDFELKSDDETPLLENKEGTIQFNIMDKTESVTDFEEYVSDTYNSARAVGMASGEIEDVTIADVQMKRFSMVMQDDDGAELEAYAYLAQINERVLLITLTSKDGGLSDVSAADAFVAQIDFKN